MEVEFKAESDHFSREDPAIEPAIDKYISALWPFGRRHKARQKLEERQTELMEDHGIEDSPNSPPPSLRLGSGNRGRALGGDRVLYGGPGSIPPG
ncbi:hypothetical protein KGY71_07335 [Candidatus Bipolaricaulota bacterium]|nr:hypothetical protein [Candidatus Bipolaricaulota bacterium]